VFQAKKDGDYYLEYGMLDDKQCATNFREVSVVKARTLDDQSFDLTSGELRIVEFPVKPKLIVRTTISGGGLTAALSAPPGSNERSSQNFSNGMWGRVRAYSWFLMNRDSTLDQTRVFYGEGTARLALRSTFGNTEKITIKNVDTLSVWNDRQAQKGSLEIGDVKLFLLKSNKSELMKVNTKAEHFQPVLDIFRLNGQIANSISDRKNHTASDDLYFPDADQFIVRLTCDGYGGSGNFALKRDSVDSLGYKLGAPQVLKLDGSDYGLYAVDLKAGQRYEFVVDHPDWPVRVDLLDSDGQFLASRRMEFDGVAVEYFVPTVSGRHRLWLRSGSGTWHFKLQSNVPPKV